MMYSDWLYRIGYNDPLPSGVYVLVNVITGKLYVGSTRDLTHRATQHFKALEEGTHHNRELQINFDTYGANSFSFIVLERTPDIDRLELLEQTWLNRLKRHAYLFNKQWTIHRHDNVSELEPVEEWIPIEETE